MSKTKQRQVSSKSSGVELKKQGYNDAINGKNFKWRKHPKIKYYSDGFEAGVDERESRSQFD